MTAICRRFSSSARRSRGDVADRDRHGRDPRANAPPASSGGGRGDRQAAQATAGLSWASGSGGPRPSSSPSALTCDDRGAAMEEILQILPQAWTGEPFTRQVRLPPPDARRRPPRRRGYRSIGGGAEPAIRRAAPRRRPLLQCPGGRVPRAGGMGARRVRAHRPATRRRSGSSTTRSCCPAPRARRARPPRRRVGDELEVLGHGGLGDPTAPPPAPPAFTRPDDALVRVERLGPGPPTDRRGAARHPEAGGSARRVQATTFRCSTTTSMIEVISSSRRT